MTSPVIDEDVMIEALKEAAPADIGENTKRLRTGAQLLLLDAYDRKVTRDQFIAALGACTSLMDALGRHSMMTNVKDFEQSGAVTKADIEVTLAGVTKLVQQSTAQCSKMAALVHQCPRDEDRVH